MSKLRHNYSTLRSKSQQGYDGGKEKRGSDVINAIFKPKSKYQGRPQLLALIILAILSVLLLGGALTPSETHQSKTEEPTETKAQKTQDTKSAPAMPKSSAATTEFPAQKTQNATTKEQQSTIEKWFNPNTAPNWVTAAVTFVYVCVAIAQWVSIRRQAKFARRTLRAIRRQAEVAANTLRAIDRQANIADKTLDAINRQATAAEQTLAALEKQVEAAIEQGKISRISAEAAQKSAEAAIQNAKTAQLTLNIERPYIFAEEQELRAKNADRLTSIVGPIEPDPLTMNIEISFKLINRGKGVAVIDGVRIHGRITPGLFDIVNSKRTFGRNVSTKSIQLHIRQRIIGPENGSPYFGGFSLPVEDWQRILSRQNQIFVLGIIRYKDVFGRPFYKSFRFAYEPPSRALSGPAPDRSGFLYVADKKRKRDKQTIKERFETEIG